MASGNSNPSPVARPTPSRTRHSRGWRAAPRDHREARASGARGHPRSSRSRSRPAGARRGPRGRRAGGVRCHPARRTGRPSGDARLPPRAGSASRRDRRRDPHERRCRRWRGRRGGASAPDLLEAFATGVGRGARARRGAARRRRRRRRAGRRCAPAFEAETEAAVREAIVRAAGFLGSADGRRVGARRVARDGAAPGALLRARARTHAGSAWPRSPRRARPPRAATPSDAAIAALVDYLAGAAFEKTDPAIRGRAARATAPASPPVPTRSRRRASTGRSSSRSRAARPTRSCLVRGHRERFGLGEDAVEHGEEVLARVHGLDVARRRRAPAKPRR